jgi:hypothetical protein
VPAAVVALARDGAVARGWIPSEVYAGSGDPRPSLAAGDG